MCWSITSLDAEFPSSIWQYLSLPSSTLVHTRNQCPLFHSNCCFLCLGWSSLVSVWLSVSQNLQRSALQALPQSVMYLTTLYHAEDFALVCTDFHKITWSKEHNSFEDTQRRRATPPYPTLFTDIVVVLQTKALPNQVKPDKTHEPSLVWWYSCAVIPAWASIQRAQLWLHRDWLTLQFVAITHTLCFWVH